MGIEIRPQLIAADARSGFDPEDVLGGQLPAMIEPLPNGRLADAADPREGGL